MKNILAIAVGSILLATAMSAPASATWMNKAIESQKAPATKAPKAKSAKKAKAPKRKAPAKKK